MKYQANKVSSNVRRSKSLNYSNQYTTLRKQITDGFKQHWHKLQTQKYAKQINAKHQYSPFCKHIIQTKSNKLTKKYKINENIIQERIHQDIQYPKKLREKRFSQSNIQQSNNIMQFYLPGNIHRQLNIFEKINDSNIGFIPKKGYYQSKLIRQNIKRNVFDELESTGVLNMDQDKNQQKEHKILNLQQIQEKLSNIRELQQQRLQSKQKIASQVINNIKKNIQILNKKIKSFK